MKLDNWFVMDTLVHFSKPNELGFFYDHKCANCSKKRVEYYHVKEAIWKQSKAKMKDFLCFDCLESRLGRKLEVSDFTEHTPINCLIGPMLAARRLP